MVEKKKFTSIDKRKILRESKQFLNLTWESALSYSRAVTSGHTNTKTLDALQFTASSKWKIFNLLNSFVFANI